VEHMARKKKQKKAIRELIGLKTITDYSIITNDGKEIIYFIVKPSNLSVLSKANIGNKVSSLVSILKSVPEIEIHCLNSRENFEENKEYLTEREDEEENDIIKELLKQDRLFFDRIQIQMATAREFLLSVRIQNEKQREIFSYINRIEKMLKEQGFMTRRAGKSDLQKIFAVYFEQNVTTERFEDFDGERWVSE